MQQHYPPAPLMPMRAPGPATQYGVAKPAAGPADGQKGARVRMAHGAPAAPAAVAAAPTPTNAQRIQPQFQHLPRFQPPSFEGLNGALPCPDSPGSTPREGTAHCAPSESRLLCEAARRALPLGAPGAAGGAEEEPAQACPVPTATTKVGKARPVSEAPGPGGAAHLAERPVQSAVAFPAAVGSIVEYKSRSSGHWILAKVEGFDDVNQTYRLDVQPHAQLDRVRPRGGSAVQGAAHSEPSCQASVPKLSGPGEIPGAVPSRGSRRDLHAQAQAPLAPPQQALTRPALGSGASATGEGAGEAPCHPEAALERFSAGGPGDHQLLAELEVLRKSVAQLQGENDALQERLSQEASMKEHYHAELCACHEQLRQLRGSPR